MSSERSPAENPFNSPMLPVVLAIQLAKRIGLARAMTGFALRRMMTPEIKARAFADYQPTKHDVFVATFAKSGTNWMMQIAQQIAHRGAAEFVHIHQVVPWPDAPGKPVGDLEAKDVLEASPTGLRVIKTHLDTEFVPYSEEATYLTVLRDPKEVMVSSYFFLGGMLGVLRHVTFDQWFELCMREDGLMNHWAIHAASYWNWRDRPNVLVLNYREIIKEPVASIETVARIMGVELTQPELDAVVVRSTFAYMSAHESQFAPPPTPFTRKEERPKMVRRGAAGESDELMSSAQQVRIDELCQAELARLGSDFPYESAFELAAESR